MSITKEFVLSSPQYERGSGPSTPEQHDSRLEPPFVWCELGSYSQFTNRALRVFSCAVVGVLYFAHTDPIKCPCVCPRAPSSGTLVFFGMTLYIVYMQREPKLWDEVIDGNEVHETFTNQVVYSLEPFTGFNYVSMGNICQYV